MGKYNDLDIKNWRDYLGDITTDALWISKNFKDDISNYPIFKIPKRNNFPKNDSDFHGLFIPEIPYQAMLRFTKKGETVWDCFGGSGTTKRVGDILKRNTILNDLNPKQEYIIKGDSTIWNPGKKVQLIMLHPPYHDAVKYSENKNDGSNQETLEGFLNWFESIIKNVSPWLEKNRFLVLVIANIYRNGEEKTLGVWCSDIVRKQGFRLKSQIIKDNGECKAKGGKEYNLNYYRQLKFNFNNYYGDNIFYLQKI